MRQINNLHKNNTAQRFWKKTSQNKGGFIALVSILLIGALTLVIAAGASYRSLTRSNIGFVGESYDRALAIAESCAEHALLNISDDPLYSGEEEVSIDNANCFIGAIQQTGPSGHAFDVRATVLHSVVAISVNTAMIASSTQIVRWERK